MHIKGYDVVALLKKTGKEIGEDRVAVYAAQMAYTCFFSIFPLLLFFAALLSLVLDRQHVLGLLSRATATLPSGVGGLVVSTARNIIDTRGAPGLLSFGLLVAAWSGSSIFGSFRQALNAAYDVTEQRSWWKRYAIQLAMLVVSGVLVLAATLILVDGEGIVRWVGERIGLGTTFTTLWAIAQVPLAIVALVAVLFAQYYFLPHVEHQRKIFPLVGAVIGVALWIGATLLFRLYVQKFHTMNAAYGAIGAIMVLLTWMYYSSFVLLAVGELISELEAGTGRNGGAPQATHHDRGHDRGDDRGHGGGRGAQHGSAHDSGHDAAHGETVPRDHALVPMDEARAAAAWSARARSGEAMAPIGGDGRPVVRARAGGPSPGFVTLLASLADGAVALVRQELRLARLELASATRAIGAGTLLVAAGGVLALLGVLAIVSGLVLLAGDQWLPADAYWAAALIVVVIAGAVVWWLVARGRRLLSAESLAPYETVETLEEDAEWLKEPTMSGTTWR